MIDPRLMMMLENDDEKRDTRGGLSGCIQPFVACVATEVDTRWDVCRFILLLLCIASGNNGKQWFTTDLVF